MNITREQILEMTPDELREEIARRHGWERLPFPAYPHWQRPTKNGVETTLDIPDYPNDIAAAWSLLEEMAKSNAILKLTIYRGKQFIVDIQDRHYVTLTWMEGETAPLAICRAWLMWKEGGEK